MAEVEVRGLRLGYDELNPGAPGTPVVLLHGWTADATEWLPVAQRLARSRRVVLPEHRGHGRSGVPPDGRFAIEEMARDLAGLLDALKIPKCILGGHSMGGMVAQRFALMFPDRVERLILSATSGKVVDGPKMILLTAINWLLLRLTIKAMAVNIRLAYHKATPETIAKHLATGPRTVRGAYGALLRHNALEELGRIRAPTLVVSGTRDRLLPWRMGRKLAERIPGARFVAVEGGSHELMADHTDEDAKAIEGFLAS
ncbi:MAG: alpha/beta hydrolase [Halobacteria archaeon]